MAEQTKKLYTIDAAGKRLGRVASEAAKVLLGKHDPKMVKHAVSFVEVHVEHAGKLVIDERKQIKKTYERYSGFPGGRKEVRLAKVADEKGKRELIRRAVYGMLPNNKLRAVRMKRIKISE